MTTPTLAELNRYLHAALLPDTHALEKRKAAKGTKAAPAEPQYTEAQLAALAGAGITDPSSKSPEEIASILAALG